MSTPLHNLLDENWWYGTIDDYVKERGLKPSSGSRYRSSARQLLGEAKQDLGLLIAICFELAGQPYQYAGERPSGLGGLEPLKTIIKNIATPLIKSYQLMTNIQDENIILSEHEHSKQLFSNCPIYQQSSKMVRVPSFHQSSSDSDSISQVSSIISELIIELNFNELEHSLERISALNSVEITDSPYKSEKELVKDENDIRGKINDEWGVFWLPYRIGIYHGHQQGYNAGIEDISSF